LLYAFLFPTFCSYSLSYFRCLTLLCLPIQILMVHLSSSTSSSKPWLSTTDFCYFFLWHTFILEYLYSLLPNLVPNWSGGIGCYFLFVKLIPTINF
jgi:hypothetical protein